MNQEWKYRAGVLALGAVIGSGIGLLFPRTKTVETEKVVYLDRVVEVEKEVQVEKLVTVQAQQKAVKRTRTRTTLPDGTKTVTEVVDLKEVSTQGTEHDVSLTRSSTRSSEKQYLAERTKVSEPAIKDWMVTAMVGSSWETWPTVAWGGSVQRRIVGPLWVGAWGLSTGSAGASIGLSF